MGLPRLLAVICTSSSLVGCLVGAMMGGLAGSGAPTASIAAGPAERLAVVAQAEATPAVQAPAPELPRVDDVGVPGDLPAFALHGEHSHGLNIVFFQGKCGRSRTYAEAMTNAAAKHGDFLALQADVACADGTRRWSSDIVHMQERLERAFAADGREGGARDLVLVGFSQGAERIEWFVSHYPERVRGVVLMSGPVVPSPAKFRGVPVVFTAGAHEWQGTMRTGYEAFRSAGVRTKFIEIPVIAHGGIGPDGERVMNEAFDFIEAQSKRAPDSCGGAQASHASGSHGSHQCG